MCDRELRLVAAKLSACVLRYGTEDHLQAGISTVLTRLGVRHRREACLGPAGRVDFLTDLGLAIEVKIEGSQMAVARQIMRYAERDEVRALLLVTTRATHANAPIEMFLGKPGSVLFLIRSAL